MSGIETAPQANGEVKAKRRVVRRVTPGPKPLFLLFTVPVDANGLPEKDAKGNTKLIVHSTTRNANIALAKMEEYRCSYMRIMVETGDSGESQAA